MDTLDLNGAAEKLTALRKPAENTDEPTGEHIEEPTEDPTEEPTEHEDLPSDSLLGDSKEVTQDADEGADELSLDAEQVASILGIEAEKIIVDDDGLKFRAKNGENESKATLADMLKSYQLEANLNSRSMELAETKKKADEEVRSWMEKSQHLAQQQQLLAERLESELSESYKDTEWERLREEDPGEYAAQRELLRQKQDRIRGIFEEINTSIQENARVAQEHMQAQMQEYIKKQGELLSSYIPGWGSETQKDISGFLKSEGFTDNEIAAVSDARIVKLSHMAMQFKNGKEISQKKLKKPLPKVLKPGSKPSKTTVNNEKLKQARDKLRKSGDMKDAAALLKMKFKE